MFDFFASSEANLGRAGLAIALSILGTIALALTLDAMRIEPAWAALLVVATFPFVALLMSKAARAQGRRQLLYGLASLVPPLAILAFITLYSRDLENRLDKKSGRPHEG